MSDDNPINLQTHQILMMYANGVPAVDIADKFRVTVGTIYKRMNEHPKEHKAAKGELAAMRNAKYRRAGMLAIDKQIMYLEKMDDSNDTLSDEMPTIIKLCKEAEKRADLNEGKATEITEHKGIQIVKFNEIKKQDDDSE